MRSWKLRNILAILVWTSAHSLLTIPETIASATPARQLAQATPAEPALSLEQLQERARAITVQITPKDGQGSGIVIARQGQSYIVLTNEHVVRRGAPYQIKTADGVTHAATRIENINLVTNDLDLALLKFDASETYPVAQLASLSSISEGDPVYAAGYPAEVEAGAEPFNFEAGRVSLLLRQQALKHGYRLGYVIDVDKGMSGGPVLNAAGAVIAINGIRAQPNWGNPYIYTDGTSPNDTLRSKMRQASWGIPVETLAEFAPQYARLPSVSPGQSSSAPAPTANEEITQPILEIAQSTTVALYRDNQHWGTGVIVDQVGSTYYVLTANHVVTADGKTTGGSFSNNMKVIAPDGQDYPIAAQAYTPFAGIDLALVRFDSNQKYETAPLANYSSWGDRTTVAFIPHRSQTAGDATIRLRAGYLFGFAFNQIRRPDSLSSGYRLSYTNITERGMSGSPIFDSAGRVIGIHAMAEADQLRLEASSNQPDDDLQFGYSMGVPIRSFLEGAKLNRISLNYANNAETSVPLRLNPEQQEKIVRDSLQLEPPTDTDSELTWLNYGNRQLRLFRYEDAVATFEHVIKQNPNSRDAWYAKGLVLKERGVTLKSKPLLGQRNKSFEDAKVAFYRAIELASVNNSEDSRGKFLVIDAYRQLGDVLYYLRDFEGARRELETALSKYADGDIIAQLWLAPVFNELGLYPEALETCDDVIAKQGAGVAEGHFLRAQINYYSINDSQAAIEDTNQILKLQPDSAVAYQLRGIAKSSLGDFAGAIADLDRAIALQPDYAAAHAGLGFVYASMGDRQKFEANFDEALGLEPDSPDHIVLKAEAYNILGDYQAALENYQQAIFLGSEIDFQYLTLRGRIHSQNGNYDAAIQDFDAAITSEPEYSAAWLQRGSAYAQKNDRENAIQSFETAEKLQPENIWIEVSRGNAYFYLRDISAGKTAYDRAIKRFEKITPRLAAVLYNQRGLVRDQIEDYAGAAEDFEQAILQQPEAYWLYSNLGDAYLSQGETQKGLSAYNKALERADSSIHHQIYNYRGITLYDIKDYSGAVAAYTEAIEQSNQNYIYYRNRGNAYYAQGQSEPASKDYSSALEYAPESVKHAIYNDRGDARYQQENYKLAAEDYSKAVDLEPQKPLYHSNLGLAYFASGDSEAGEAALQKAIEKSPQEFKSEHYNVLGNARYRQGNYKGAIDAYDKAIEVTPKALYYSNRGDTYFILGDIDKGEADYQDVFRLTPEKEQYQYYYYRANRYFEIGEYQKAIPDYEKAIQLGGQGQPDYYAGLGAARLRLDIDTEGEDDRQGIQDYETAIDLAPENLKYIYYSQRGRIRVEQDDFGGAIADFDQAIAREPEFTDSLLQRGIANFKLGQNYPDVERDLNDVVKLNPEAAEVYLYRGLFQKNRTDAPNLEAAIQDFGEAIRLNSNLILAYQARAQARFDLEDFDGTIEDTTVVLEKDLSSPERPWNFLRRGISYAKTENKPLSLIDLQQAEQLFQQSAEQDESYVRGLEWTRSWLTGLQQSN